MFFSVVSEEASPSILTWKFTFDNPNVLGWTVVAVYIAAAICCARAGVESRVAAKPPSRSLWWRIAAGLIFLGINKQLNLQTLMIVVGRNVSNIGHWYGARRQVQLIFSVVFGAVCTGTVIWLSWRYRRFFTENPWVLAGAIVLAIFVVLRAATINHVDTFLRINLKDKDWAWVLEIAGSLLIAAGALRRTAGHRLE